MSFFFLMASERSGSNFITKLLNGHPDICGPSTKHIINPLARNLFRYKDLKNKKNWDQLLKDLHRLISIDFSIWKKKFSLTDLKKLAQTGDVISLIKNIFIDETIANQKHHVFIKENHIYEFMVFLLIHFPESKYVYLVRDPRDMALSWKKNTNHPGGVVKAARQWKKDQMNTLKNYSELEKKGMAYHVKYEDLITNTEAQAKKICAFLGVPYHKKILKFYQDDITKLNAQKLAAWNNLSQQVITNNKNKFLKELNDFEIKCIEKICFPEMKFLGYNPIYNQSELDELSEEQLIVMDNKEMDSIKHLRDKGVLENMQAKKIFYHKLL